jgi:hypothetical protein
MQDSLVHETLQWFEIGQRELIQWSVNLARLTEQEIRTEDATLFLFIACSLCSNVWKGGARCPSTPGVYTSVLLARR